MTENYVGSEGQSLDNTNPLMTSNYIIHVGLEKIKSLFKKELFLELDNFAKCVYDNVVGLCRKTVCVFETIVSCMSFIQKVKKTFARISDSPR